MSTYPSFLHLYPKTSSLWDPTQMYNMNQFSAWSLVSPSFFSPNLVLDLQGDCNLVKCPDASRRNDKTGQDCRHEPRDRNLFSAVCGWWPNNGGVTGFCVSYFCFGHLVLKLYLLFFKYVNFKYLLEWFKKKKKHTGSSRLTIVQPNDFSVL